MLCTEKSSVTVESGAVFFLQNSARGGAELGTMKQLQGWG